MRTGSLCFEENTQRLKLLGLELHDEIGVDVL
jgi:hypothetical protein